MEKVEVVKDTNEYVYIPEVFSLDGLMGVNSYAQTKDGIYLLAPYFAGEKSANEVANIIQNRVQMYVNENN